MSILLFLVGIAWLSLSVVVCSRTRNDALEALTFCSALISAGFLLVVGVCTLSLVLTLRESELADEKITLYQETGDPGYEQAIMDLKKQKVEAKTARWWLYFGD